MEILQVTSYAVNGKYFPTPEKAFAYVDDLIAEHVRQMFLKSGASYKEIISCTEYVLENRKALATLLAVEPFRQEEEY